jgi:hypothetical protein
LPMQVEPAVGTVRGAPKSIRAVAVLACAWPALLLATVCLVPYLNKPFDIDDPYFLAMARQIVKHPAHPIDFELCWNIPSLAGECRNAFYFASGNPVLGQVGQGYVLVPAVLGGAHEWAAHLTQLVLVWIAIVAMTLLIFRFGWDRWHATIGALLLVAIPPFLPMASTAMPDILATAVALVAMERLAGWKSEGKWGQGAAAAIALGLAGFTRPHLVLLLPLGAFFLLDSIHPREVLAQVRRKLWLWAPVIAGGCLLVILMLALREHNLGLDPKRATNGQNIGRNLFAYFLFLAFPFPLAACWLVNRVKARRRLTIFIALAAALVPWVCPISRALAASYSLAIFGCAALFGLLLDVLKKRDRTALFLLLWILVPFPAVYYEHFPIKYLLPCVPAIVLLCFRLIECVPLRVAGITALATILASTAYSMLILRSDDEFAKIGRNSMYQLIAPHVAAGEQVWYPGHYWSYWYAPLAGAKLTYPGGPQPKAGDLLVDDVFAGGDASIGRFQHRTLVETIHYEYSFGRTMGAGMGLYSNAFGFWLWGFGESDKDRFELWRID